MALERTVRANPSVRLDYPNRSNTLISTNQVRSEGLDFLWCPSGWRNWFFSSVGRTRCCTLRIYREIGEIFPRFRFFIPLHSLFRLFGIKYPPTLLLVVVPMRNDQLIISIFNFSWWNEIPGCWAFVVGHSMECFIWDTSTNWTMNCRLALIELISPLWSTWNRFHQRWERLSLGTHNNYKISSYGNVCQIKSTYAQFIILRKLSFLFGGVSTVILLFFMFVDEDVAHIEHILQIVSILTLLAIISRYVFELSSARWRGRNRPLLE